MRFVILVQKMQVVSVSVGVHYFLPTLIGCHGIVPWQIRKRSRSIICTQSTFIRSKNCENRSSKSWDVPLNMPFLLFRTKSSQMSPVNSGVTGPKFAQFLHDVEASLTLLTRTLTYRSSIMFLNDWATSEGRYAICTVLVKSYLCTLRYWKQRSRTIICIQSAFVLWKDCNNQSSRSWDNILFSKRSLKRRKKESN